MLYQKVLIVADKVMTGTYTFVTFTVKIRLLALSSLLISFSLRAADKTQYFVHLSFSSTFQLNDSISSDPQKLLKYFNGTEIVKFLEFH